MKSNFMKIIQLSVVFSLGAVIFIQGCTLPNKQVLGSSEYQNFIPLIINESIESTSFSSFGPDGGTIGTIEIDPNNPNVVYAGTWGNGIYKSPDRGVTWIPLNNGLVSGFLFDIAVDPANSLNMLVSAYHHGAYISRDGGANWIKTNGMPQETVVYSFAYDPTDTDIVYAAVREQTVYEPEVRYPGGIYRSIDGGQSWVKISSGLPDDYVYEVLVDPNNVSILYAGLHKTGVYKSTNSGKNWFSVNNNIHYRDVRSMDINPLNGTLYVGLYDGRGVAFSKDGGASWSKIDSSITQSVYVYSLVLNPQDFTSLYLSGPDGIYRCSGSPYPSQSSACKRIAHGGEYVFAVALDRTSSIIYSGLQDACLFKSADNGASFQPSYAGIKANVINTLINDPDHPEILYASALGRGLYKSTDQGSTWTHLSNGVPKGNVNQLIFRPGNSNVIYAATQSEGIFMSNNAGASWSALNQGVSFASKESLGEKGRFQGEGFNHPAYEWMDPVDIEAMRNPIETISKETYTEILSIGIDPSNTARMIAGTAGNGILKSNDSGSSWMTTDLSSGSVYAFMVDLNQSNYIHYAGVLDAGVRRSDTSRNAWPTAHSGMHAGADVYGLAMASSGVYYAATESGVYMSNDAGGSWLQTGLAGIALTDIFVHPSNHQVLYASSTNGLYQSLDAGVNWSLVSELLLNNRFLTIAQGYGFDSVYFGMSGGNIYRFGD
jgi:photosystem II stability/assembly factor-like uncharacterized protein